MNRPHSEIPETWIPTKLLNTGFLPDTGLRRSGGKLVQAEAGAVRLQVIVLTILGLAAFVPVSLIGWSLPYSVQVVVALGLFWGAICLFFVPRLLRTRFGLQVEIDLSEREVQLTNQEQWTRIPMDQIVGLQVLFGEAFHQPGFQLNLLWKDENQRFQREMLYASTVRRFVERLATEYERETGWSILD